MLLAILIATIVFCAIFTYVRLRTIPFLGRCLTPVTEFLDNLTRGLRLGPLEQVATVLFLAGATTWVLRHPESPLWQEVTGADASPRQVMLASAVGLIALITFTVTSSMGVVRDRTGQNTTYLGRSEHDYLVTRSGVTGILWAPIFPLLIVFLFAAAAVEPLLTDSWTLICPRPLRGLLGDLSVTVPLRLLALSLWCSAFIVVSTSLLLNLTMMLRTTMIRLLNPDYVRYRIKREVEDDYARDLTSIARLNANEQRQKTRRLTRRAVDLLRESANGEPGELNDALHATLRPLAAFWGNFNQTKRWKKLIELAYARSGRPSREGTHQVLRTRTNRNPTTQVRKMWNTTEHLASGRREAFMEYLRMVGQEPSAHRVVLEGLLSDSIEIDQRFHELLNGNEVECLDPEAPVAGLIHDCLCDPDRLPRDWPSLSGNHHYRGKENSRPVSEQVITSIAMIYRAIAELLTDYSSPASIHVTVNDLETILNHAGHIQHRPTREYAVDQVADAVIQATIISRHENEELGTDTLSMLVPSLRNRSRMPGPAPHDSSDVKQPEEATYRSTTDLIHDVVLRHLRESHSLDPAARSVLLGFVDDTEVLANILYTLLYAAESHRLRAELLRPFLPYTRRIYLDKEERGRHRDRVAWLLLKGTGISNRVNAEAATWLVDLLGRPLTLNELKDVGTAPRLFGFSWLSVVLWWALLTPTTSLYTEFFTDAQLEALDANGWGDETRGRDAVLEAISILTELGEDRKASQLQFMIRRSKRPPNGESPKSTPT